MSQVNDKNSKFHFTGWHMMACMAAFFGVIISVNLFMATLAYSSWTGLVVKNSYVASQHFNAKLLAAEKQKKRGWRSAIEFHNDEFEIQLYGKNAEKLILTNVELFVGRPAFEHKDRLIKLEHLMDGVYRTKLFLGFGEWDVRITGKLGEFSYRREERMFVDANGVGRIEFGDKK